MKKLMVTALLLILSGCSTPSSLGRYPDNPPTNSDVSRVVQYSRDETMEAVNKAFLRSGYTPEERNEKLGRITGNGIFQCAPGLEMPVTIVVYIQQINSKPETRYSIIADRHSLLACWGGGGTQAANALSGEIMKVLSTY